MANFKLVISDPQTKKAYQKEIEQGPSGLTGKKIGDMFSGDIMGLTGYELQITGGSDRDGFPMRRDVTGTVRKRILLAYGPGFHPRLKGQRKRKSIRGNTISPEIAQINAKITKHGAKPIEELLGVKKAEKPEAKREKHRAGEEASKQEAEQPAGGEKNEDSTTSEQA